jgi:hypothetical protein
MLRCGDQEEEARKELREEEKRCGMQGAFYSELQ